MLFLLDAQLPRGAGRSHCDAGPFGPPSNRQIACPRRRPGGCRACELAWRSVLVSKDQDFLDLSVRGILEGQFLWIRSGIMTTARLWSLFEPLLPQVVRSFEEGERVVEIR